MGFECSICGISGEPVFGSFLKVFKEFIARIGRWFFFILEIGFVDDFPVVLIEASEVDLGFGKLFEWGKV